MYIEFIKIIKTIVIKSSFIETAVSVIRVVTKHTIEN